MLARNGNGAVGWLIPQPWVVDEKGDTVRFDDVIGGRWTVLHIGPAAPWQAWRSAGVPIIRIAPPGSAPAPDCIFDQDGTLTRWLGKKKASVVAVRPDGFVYAGGGDQPLPPPPSRLTATPRPVNDEA